MDHSSKDAGTIAALMKRFSEYRLPRMLRLLEHVRAGERIGDSDLEFLKRVYEDSRSNQLLYARNPEYSDLISRALSLYEEIIERSLENEKAGNP
jgi:hypothetical protein